MVKLVKNQFILSVKDASFVRCVVYTIFAASGLVAMTWMLGNYLPIFFGEVLQQMSLNGQIRLGFIAFESIEQLQNMTVQDMLSVAYASPLISVIIAVLSVELFGKNLENGYFLFLISRRVSRIKIYMCGGITAFLLSAILYSVFGITCIIAGWVGYGLQPIDADIVHILLQGLVLLAQVTFFTFGICVGGKMVPAIISVILLTVGLPEMSAFLAALFQKNSLQYFWIGSCVTYNNENDVLVIIVSMIYIVVFGFLGGAWFCETDI